MRLSDFLPALTLAGGGRFFVSGVRKLRRVIRVEQAIRIEMVANPTLNHAMTHNGLPLIQRITVHNDGTAPWEALTVVVEVRDTFGTVINRPWQTHIDLVGGANTVIDRPAVQFDPGVLATLEEEMAGEITVRVSTSDRELGATHRRTAILAARQWQVTEDAQLLALELLAAFVQPNHPAVAEIVAEAAGRLSDLATRDASPERIDMIVDAVIEAVHARQIHYAPPPASWGKGQKVRTPGDVLETTVGTCLDTTVLLAAVLEQIGINPVLWVADGHAFVGYWRQAERHLPDAASFQCTAAINAVDLALMGVIESTHVTAEHRRVTDVARRARQSPVESWLRNRSEDLTGVVDVAEARLMGVLPLPARRTRDDGVVEIIEYHAAELTQSPRTSGPRSSDRDALPTSAVPARVQRWKNALLDLTLNNKLLNLGKASAQLQLVLPSEHLGVLAEIIQADRPLMIRAADDIASQLAAAGAKDAWSLPSDLLATMLGRATVHSAEAGPTHNHAVESLRSRARTIVQETGANPLMLTLGTVQWQLGGRELSAPLVLCPVQATSTMMPFRVGRDEAGEITVNLSLLEKLRLEYGLEIPELDVVPRTADGGVDVDAILRIARVALNNHGLPFRVVSDARLVVAQFTGYLLWRDLDQHWAEFCTAPLVNHLVHTPTEPFGGAELDLTDPSGLDDLDDVVAACPIPADGSQALAVANARAGRSFVLEGPPGTGKSQTITNIIADQMALGRSVLFVAAKGAALDVVRTRLDHAGLGGFVLDLHDRNSRPTQVRAALRAALGQQPLVDDDGYQVDARQVASTAKGLATYAGSLHAPNTAGLSLYTARTRLLAEGEGPVATLTPAELDGVDQAALTELRRALTDAVPQLAQHSLDPARPHPWSFARVFPEDDLRPALTAADEAVAIMMQTLSAPEHVRAVRACRAPAELAAVSRLLAASWSPDHLDQCRDPNWARTHDELAGLTATLRSRAEPILAQFRPSVVEVELEPVRQAVRLAASSFFIGRKGRLTVAAADVLAHLHPQAEMRAKEIPALVEELAILVSDHDQLRDRWRTLPGLLELPDRINLLAPPGAAVLQSALDGLAGDAELMIHLPSGIVAAVRRARQFDGRLTAAAAAQIDRVREALTTVFEAVGSSPADLARFGTAGLVSAWQDSAPGRQADASHWVGLRRWTDLQATLAPVVTTLPSAAEELLTGRIEALEAVAAVERGLAVTSQDERWSGTGLTGFDGESHDRTVARFVDASQRLRDDLRDVLPAAVVQGRPFRSSGLVGRVGALEREVGRTRGGLSVRRLMQTYGEVISEVTPCVLVSPDSLARFVPYESMNFDLVVFDEASQIRVPEAIGAIARAKAVVVAGDSKQMPPTSVFAVTDQEADEAESDFVTVADEESVLSECVLAGVPRLWLSWHYRSRDESLITFSNRAHYEGRLASFPSPPGIEADEGLEFRRVDGLFVRAKGRRPDATVLAALPIPAPSREAVAEFSLLRTNPAEAAAVVAEVLERWRRGEQSIGVVTFNVQQRSLIERMLWESQVPGVQESLDQHADGLFVKNLETVQGDERDLIIFSSGFAANDAGVLPLNFGPLNRAGGERRLNVAITRARRKVMVFSSFDPEDMRVEQTSSVGVKHLRTYLELARDGATAATGHADGSALAPPVATTRVDRHRDEVAQALRRAGLEVDAGVGLSEFQVDLAVGRDGTRTVAILLDGPVWHQRRTVGDRDGMPKTVLRSMMGWPVVTRIWLPDWLRDPDQVVARIRGLVDQDQDDPVAEEPWLEIADNQLPDPTPPAADIPPAAIHTAADIGDGPIEPSRSEDEIATEFQPYPVSIAGTKGELGRLLTRSDPQDKAGRLVAEIIEAEGPIRPERMARLLISCFGLSRLGAARLEEVLALVPDTVTTDPEEDFLWPASKDPLQWQGHRRWDGPTKERPLDDIALREIGNAMTDLARSAMGITRDELRRETCRVFGGSRVTEGIAARLDRALEVAVARGQLVDDGGNITAS